MTRVCFGGQRVQHEEHAQRVPRSRSTYLEEEDEEERVESVGQGDGTIWNLGRSTPLGCQDCSAELRKCRHRRVALV